jgi:hypothetical protein
MQPTDEQALIVGRVESGAPLIVEAGAGTGKTSTLVMAAEAAKPRTGTYVAFNRAIVVEARTRMPLTVHCSTAHALAMQQVGGQFRHRLDSNRMKSWQLARHLGVGAFAVRYGAATKVLQPGYLAGQVMRGVLNFCMSADPEPLPEHLPYLHGIDPLGPDGKRTWANNDALRAELILPMKRAWGDLQLVDGKLPYRHDHYLKFWQLNGPRIPGDFILFDEGQDASPVMLDAVAQQDAQLVVVGDTQQQIYEWRGAVNALARVAGEKAFLTQSFRFGPPIAELANAVLELLHAELRLVGSPAVESAVARVMHPHVVLARTNAVAVESVLGLQRQGYKTHLVGGGEDVVAFAKGAAMLMDGERAWHPDLACFDSWGEVQDYVANDPQGDELKVLANLVDEYGVDIILQALEQTTAEVAADVVVSTAHKAKGREWGRVRLAGDFPGEVDPTQPGEMRLLYVAATRAANRLDVSGCGALSSLVPQG